MKPLDPTVPEAYHHWYYSNQLWAKTSFLGIPCLKSVSDMWNYQEILTVLRPSLVIEFGTHSGGSTLFYSSVLKLINPKSKVFSVDVDHSKVDPSLFKNPDIELFKCSSADPRVADRIRELRSELPGPVFAILDSDHRKEHVLAEMKLLRPLLLAGDYLVVEDSNINGHPVLPDWGPGPMEAMVEYFEDYPDDYTPDTAREEKFGFTFATKGFLVRN